MPRHEHIASQQSRLAPSSGGGSDVPPDRPRLNTRLIESGLTHVLAPRAAEKPVFVLDQSSGRAVDEGASAELGIPTLLLMENAAIWLAAFAAAIIPETAAPGALIIAGKGSNGGDGLAMARHLVNRGWNVGIVLAAAADAYTGDAAVNLRICQKSGFAIISAAQLGAAEAIKQGRAAVGTVSLVVDALLGTGLSGPLRRDVGELIRGINQLGASGVPVLAVDIPSGLEADTGEPALSAAEPGSDAPAERLAVQADVTVTLVGIKPGFLELAAQKYIGELLVADIGVPPSLIRRLGRPLNSMRRPGGGDIREDGNGGRRATRGTEPTRTSREPLPYRPGTQRPPKLDD
ncbi:MAG: NAD(P)H-hydrate epimerase [Pyrinomonadaceae bacterium]|nr:NAD(P)H-hydrate epimerase [Phycisphaerales bacterium]